MDIPESVRRLALYPFRELPQPPDVERVEFDGAFLAINPWPTAQVVSMRGRGPADVEATVAAARAVARERGKTIVAWWVPPDQDHVAPALEAAGLVNEDTPGFESIENALVLLAPPHGDRVDSVEVRMTEMWEDFRDGARVVEKAFGMPVVSDDELRARYDDYRHPDNPGRGFIALIDGRVVATSYAAFGTAGVNLFGGSVLPEVRGRGVYRALLGFVFLAPVRVFVDLL
jgi:hypothetical protein